MHENAEIISAGTPLKEADAALILVHGRGATADSILELAPYVARPGMAYLAPQAQRNEWYPYSFLEPLDRNQPWLDSALDCLARVVAHATRAGLTPESIAIGGFSQGACLTLEYAVRNPRRYAAVLGLSGGLIGPPGTRWNESGSLESTPVFLGCSDVDFHIPVERVHESAAVLRKLGANVTEKIYPGMGHTLNQDEIDVCRAILNGV